MTSDQMLQNAMDTLARAAKDLEGREALLGEGAKVNPMTVMQWLHSAKASITWARDCVHRAKVFLTSEKPQG